MEYIDIINEFAWTYLIDADVCGAGRIHDADCHLDDSGLVHGSPGACQRDVDTPAFVEGYRIARRLCEAAASGQGSEVQGEQHA